jgi:hypothetical protein
MAPVVWISPSPCRPDAPLPRFRPVSMVPKSPLCHALYRQPIVPVLPLHASIPVRAQVSYFWTCCQCFHHIACLHSTPTFALNRLASHTPVSPSSHRSRTKREGPTLNHDRFNLECAVLSPTSRYSVSPRGVVHRSRLGLVLRSVRPPTNMAAPPHIVDAACPRPSFPSSSLFLAPLCSSLLLGGPGHTTGPIAAASRATNSIPPAFRTHTGSARVRRQHQSLIILVYPHSVPIIPLRDAQETRDASTAKQSHLAACVLSACASNHLNRTHAREPGVLAASTAYPSRPRSRQAGRVWPPGRSTLDARRLPTCTL